MHSWWPWYPAGDATERGPGSTGAGRRHFLTSLFLSSLVFFFLPPSVFLECP